MNPIQQPTRIAIAATLIPMLLISCALLTGCVQRRLTIQSNPPGALVKVDDVEIGTTPVSTSFVYYGTRKIQLIKPGYETLTLLQPIPTPWYQLPGLDFFSEHFVPGGIRDYRLLSYELKPSLVVPNEQLLQRAEQLRRDGSAPGIPPQQLPVPGRPPRQQPPLLPPAPNLPVPGESRLPF